MAETLEQLSTRILKAVPRQKHNEFLDWAISGQPIRTEAEKQDIITAIKQEARNELLKQQNSVY